MEKVLRIRAILNKKNGQINLSLPKRKLGKKASSPGKFCLIKFQGWEGE